MQFGYIYSTEILIVPKDAKPTSVTSPNILETQFQSDKCIQLFSPNESGWVQLVPEIELMVEAVKSNDVFDPLEFLGTDLSARRIENHFAAIKRLIFLLFPGILQSTHLENFQ